MADGGETSEDSIDITMRKAGENLDSLRKTIAAIDNLETRWKDIQKRFGEALAISLSSAFGGEPPNMLKDEEKVAVFGGSPTLEELCKRLEGGSYTNIIVMAGAGISVSAGIPDFRSPGSGLYDTLDLKRFKVPSAQAVFDLEFFNKNPEPFFILYKELFCEDEAFEPTPTHYFIRLLEAKKLLLRCYTQNIDGLERRAGLPQDALVEAHGSYEDATCTNSGCRKLFLSTKTDLVKRSVLKGITPRCDSCSGIVKPNIIFFGEDLPTRFKTLLDEDFAKCDLLIVIGTSLQVQPFCSLIHRVKQTTPRLLINKNRVGNFTLESEGGYRDIAVLEECDKAIGKICHMCKWTQDLTKFTTKTQESGTAKESTPKTSTPKASRSEGSSPKIPAATTQVSGHIHQRSPRNVK